MKNRFAHFLVSKSRIILILFIALALGCAALIPFVNVNYDMTEYLAKDSPMRHGIDLMEAEFGEEESSSLEVMFEDLDTLSQRQRILGELERIPKVESVDYEVPSEDEEEIYNKGKYTRYIINCEYDKYSDEASGIWSSVRDAYEEDHLIYLGGEINEANVPGLPLWIAIVAVCLVVLILLIMANSLIEPVAFLITIGIAVLINMGTYFFFPSISNTTFGIVAILQLVLSMDYSIMLLNRYRQQRQVIPDKRESMRRALSLSFGAITGSSLTTYAGLLALLFMSFRMGADIGMALAKGVIISLLCIFTVLPALLLAFDDLMIRTSKKTLSFDMPRFSGFQYRLRIPITLLFLAMFIGSFIAREGVDFTYAQVVDSKINRIFGHTNTMVMIYDEEDGKSAGALAELIDERKDVRSAVCYESTLGKKRTAADMKDFIEDVNDEENESDVDLTLPIMKLIYYDHFVGDPDFGLKIPAFVTYLRDRVMEDPDFNDSIEDEDRDRIDDMEKFTDVSRLTASMGAGGLADFFEMTRSQSGQLLLYYQIKSGNDSGGRMSLPGFIDFLLKDVATDPDYGSMIKSSQKRELENMQIFSDRKAMTSPMAYGDAATILSSDAAQMRMIYIQHLLAEEPALPMSGTMTLTDLGNTIDAMSKDPVLSPQFGGEDMLRLAGALKQIGLMDPSPYDPATMSEVLNGYSMPLDIPTLTLIYSYKLMTDDPDCHLISMQDLVAFMLENENINSTLPAGNISRMEMLRRIIDTSVSGRKLKASSIAGILTMKKSDVRSIYLLHKYKKGDTSGWKLSPQQFINFLVDKVLSDPDMKGKIGGNADELKSAKKLINSVVAGSEFTYKELADLFAEFDEGGFSPSDLQLVYELYGSENHYDDSWTMDLVAFARHLDEKMVTKPAFVSAMDEDQIEDIHSMRKDMDDAAEKLEGKHYGRMMITAVMDDDSDESRSFMKELTAYTDDRFSGDTYLIGNTPMAYEMSRTFRAELNKITLLTALFIFIIVLLTFRNLVTSCILVLIIQCAVFMTMAILQALNIDMNYLALLIVQSIMMGATIDYAIVYSSYYVESRDLMGVRESIRASYKGSLQTILTSAIILIVAAGLLSFAFGEPSVREICRILAVGCFMATILVVFILPGILACLDSLVSRSSSRLNEEKSNAHYDVS